MLFDAMTRLGGKILYTQKLEFIIFRKSYEIWKIFIKTQVRIVTEIFCKVIMRVRESLSKR